MSKDYNVDSFVVDLSFNDKVTKKLAEIEKKTLAAANRIESALNKAFRVSPNFGNVVNSAKVAAAGIQQAASHINWAGNGKMQIRSLELQGIQAAHKIGEALKRATVNNPLPKPLPPANPPAPKGGRNSKGLNPAVKDVEKVTAAVTALESKVSAASQRMEQHLNRAFHINPKFGNLVTQVNNTANAVKTAFKHGFNIANPAVSEIKKVETAGVAAARRIGVEMRKAYKISGSYNPPVPPKPAPRGGNTQPPANRINTLANSQYLSGLTRRLEGLGAGGLERARKLRQSIYSASQDARVSGDVERFRLQVKRLNQVAQNWADSQRRSTQHANELNNGLGKLAMGAGALYAAFNVAKKSLDVGIARQGANISADSVFKGDSKNAKVFAADFAQDIGQKYTETLKQYTSFAAGAQTSMGYQGSQDFYKNAAMFGRIRGLDAEQMKGIMVAFTQMASKGQIQAEELRGQLGDRLPGSEQTVADALGLDLPSINNLMKNGKLLAKDVLPKVNKQFEKLVNEAGGMEKIQSMTVTQLGKVSYALENDLNKAFVGSEKGVGVFSAALANLLNDSGDISEAIGAGFGSMLKVAARWIDYIDWVANQTDAAVLRMKAWYMDLDPAQQKLVDGAGKFAAEVATAVVVVGALTAAVKTLKLTAALTGMATGKGAGGGVTAGEAAAAGWGSRLLKGASRRLPLIGTALLAKDAVDYSGAEGYLPKSLQAGGAVDNALSGRWMNDGRKEGFENSRFMAMVNWLQSNNALKDTDVKSPLSLPEQVTAPSSESLEKAKGFIANMMQVAPPASEAGQFDKSSLFSPVQPKVEIAAPQIRAQQNVTVQVDMGGYTREFQGSVISNEFENVNINTEHLED